MLPLTGFLLSVFWSCFKTTPVSGILNLCQKWTPCISFHFWHLSLKELKEFLCKQFCLQKLKADFHHLETWKSKSCSLDASWIRTDSTSKGYQHVTMCLIIKLSLKKVRRTIKLLHNIFWKGLASSIEKKEKSCFSFLIVIWKDKVKQLFMFLPCQLTAPKKSEKTSWNRNLQTEAERSKKINKPQKVKISK